MPTVAPPEIQTGEDPGLQTADNHQTARRAAIWYVQGVWQLRSLTRFTTGIHPVAKDVLLAVVLAVTLIVDLAGQDLPAESAFREADPFGYVLVVLLVLPLAVRTLLPLTVFFTILAAASATAALLYLPSSFGFGLIIATYTVARWCERPTSWVALILGQAFVTGAKLRALAAGIDINWFVWPIDAVYIGGAWFLGDSIRTGHRYAEELEANREELARRAIAEERARVARELHDTVGHSVSVMVVHAGAAEAVIDTDSQQARQALQSIGTVGRDTLAEMDRVLDVLSTDGESDTTRPGLAHLNALVDEYRQLGLDVHVSVEGQPVPLSPKLDLPAFRIIQEALTNTLKHAGTHQAEVTVTYGTRNLALKIRDDGRGSPRVTTRGRPRAGRGLVGMRERVSMLEGRFEAGPDPEGGFVVSAELPITGGDRR